MVTPLAKLRSAMAAAYAPRPRVTLADWCGANVYLPAETGLNPGRIDWDRFPFGKEIVNAAEDPEVEQITMTGGTQWGKTTLLQLILIALAERHPAPAMLVAPDQDATRKLRNKFYGMCDATPALRGKIPPEHKRNMSEIDFGNSLCHLAWTGNPQRVSAESCRVVLVTEVDRAHRAMREGALHKLIAERVKAWHNYLKVFEGTPTDENSTILSLYDDSSKETFRVPCLHCGHHQPLRFFCHKEGDYPGCGGVGGLKDDNGNWLSSDKVADSAYYICEKGCRIEQRDKDAMVRHPSADWVPDGCTLEDDGRVTGTPKRSRRHRGFGGLCSLYSDTISLGRMAAEYIDSRDKPAEMRNFINNWCGLKWLEPTKTPKWSTLGRRLRAGHRRGTVPGQALFLTSGDDVQADCVYWIVRAWGEGCTSWLIDWGRINKPLDHMGHAPPDSHLTPLDGLVITRKWPLVTANALGATELGILKMGIDSGHTPLVVHNFARKYHSDLVLTVAGDAKPTQGVPYSFNIVERNQRTGKVYPGGMRRHAINTDHYKTDIMGRWTAPLDEPGAWFVTDTPLDDAATYLRQITNEGLVTVTAKTGHTRQQWRVLQPGIGNHFLDCYDSETQVLTRNGWRYFSDIDTTDQLATNNLETDKLEYQKPSHVIAKDYSGEMVQIGGDPFSRLNLLVTPGHRMVVFEGQSSRGPLIKAAGDLTIWDKIKTRVAWCGSPDQEFIIPSTLAMPERVVARTDLAYMLGWYIAEGYCQSVQHHSQPGSTKRRVMIYQNPGTKRDLLRAGLERLPWRFHETDRGLVYSNQQVYNIVDGMGDSYTKRVPVWIKESCPEVIQSFIDGAVLGDGWTQGKSQSYATVSEGLADDMQELYLKTGCRASVDVRPAKTYLIRGRNGSNTMPQYHVRRNQVQWALLRNSANRPNFRRVHYTGKVYCATVPNGTLIVRRKGKVAVCGNCEVYAFAVADMVVGGNWEGLAARMAPPPKQLEQSKPGGFVGRRKSGSFVNR